METDIMAEARRDTAAEFSLDGVKSASDVDRWYRRMFATAPRREGVVHVVATWRDGDGGLEVLSTDDDAPRCPEDAFALAVARARADAILTTGAVLRQEPRLRHEPGLRHEPRAHRSPLATAIADWRAANGRRRPAASVIMSRSRDIDLDHPIFDGDQIFVYTGDDAPPRFGIELAQRGAMLITDPEPTPRSCLARLERAGYDAITVEAGPRVASMLYEAPAAIDELLLTTFEAPDLDPDHHRGRLIDEGTLVSRLGSTGDVYRTTNEHGPWSLRRFTG